MRIAVVQRILGILLIIFSATMIPPMVISIIFDDGTILPFVFGFAFIIVIGIAIWFPVRNNKESLRTRDGFLVVALFWIVLGLSGTAPFLLADNISLSFTDAAFESISGLTTTGATILTRYSHLSKSMLYYRQQLHWFGGMGIIVLAVAILPMLGIGGMQMYKAETTGLSKDTKLTPRIRETAKILWYIYLSLTLICLLSYWLAGMSLFDAICHSFATIATGGFSNYEASLGHYKSSSIEWLATFFMFLGGANFSLHFLALRGRSCKTYLQDQEFKAYLLLHLLFAGIIAATLLLSHTYQSLHDAIRDSLFHTVSIGTTTGFITSGFSHWPSFVPILVIFIGFFGGCSGSTAGGIKTVRALLLIKQGRREIHRIIHPNAQIVVKMGGHAVNERIINAVWGFFAAYSILFIIMMLVLMGTGLDLLSAFSVVAATLNNVGPGLGAITTDFSQITTLAKWVSIFAMLLGRLEVFTLLVLLTPAFWKN